MCLYKEMWMNLLQHDGSDPLSMVGELEWLSVPSNLIFQIFQIFYPESFQSFYLVNKYWVGQKFHNILWKNPNEIFGQPNIYVPGMSGWKTEAREKETL